MGGLVNMENNISDKELLAICNLSNLKMEFADLVNKSGKKDIDDSVENYTNHTIYSLLDKEYKRLKGNLALTEENVSFYQMDDKKNVIPEYRNLEELRKTAPIAMEYYDRYRESGKNSEHEGVFLDEWKIIYGEDNYKIGAEFIKASYNKF